MKNNLSLAVCILISFFICAPSTLLAQSTWYVPDDFATIQDGIDGATNGDTVIVRDGIYTERIVLNGRAITLISENGSGTTTISGSGLGGSVVTVQNGEGPDTVIEGFTITQGYADFGGGVVIYDSSPTLRNNLISSNHCNYDGGGVYAEYGEVNIESCTFISNSSSNNYVEGGGAFFKAMTGSISNCVFQGNSLSGTDSKGGGISMSGSTLFISNSSFIYNRSNDGGAIYQTGGDLSIDGGSFQSNSTNRSYGYGGAIVLIGRALIENTVFDSNSAANSSSGGAIYAVGSAGIDIFNCEFVNNNSDVHGGAIDAEGLVTIDDCIFDTNESREGNAISLRADAVVAVEDSEFVNNGSASVSSYGAIYLYDYNTELQLSRSSFVGNSSASGGAIFNGRSNQCIITDCSFKSNSASDNGGAIYSTDIITLDNCLLVGNSSSQGGAIWSGSGCTLISTTIANNTATTGSGVWSSSNLTLNSSISWGNDIYANNYGSVSALYSCIEGGLPGIGNTPYDPHFTSGPMGDYYLSTLSAGQTVESVCIDRGDPSRDTPHSTTSTDETPDSGIVDIGYHYYLAPPPPPPPPVDTDNDGITDEDEASLSFTDPNDDDSDDDGLSDGEEFYHQLNLDPNNFDTDGDLLSDGLEVGLTSASRLSGTDPLIFVADADPTTTTSPVLRDTDGGGVIDSDEDVNLNGMVDGLETNPSASFGSDDIVIGEIIALPSSVSMSAGGIVQLQLDFDDKYADQRYMVLGTTTGISTGFQVGLVTVPINFSGLTAQTLQGNYYNQMVNFDSQLDMFGNALAMIVLAPNSPSSYVGLTTHWTAVVLPLNGYPSTVADTAELLFAQ